MVGFAYNSEQPMNAIGWGNRRPKEGDRVGPCSTGLIDLRDQPDSPGIMVEAVLPGALAAALPEMRTANATGPANGTVRWVARAFYV